MGYFQKFFLVIVAVFSVYIGLKINKLYEVPPLPTFEDTWWGPGTPGKEDTSIKPFKISVSDEVLKDLQQRLANHRPFIPPLEGIQNQYGINTNLLNEIVEFWKSSYNWKEQEKFLNQYPQYTTSVQGLKIHYLHVKPKEATGIRVLPLLMLHGWPGSIREFYEIIPYLTTPQKNRDFVFEVIAPSLPGYGFSDAAVRPGLDDKNMAVVFKNFMKRLGFPKFYLQGGDWGAVISQNLATLYQDLVLGVHSNACIVSSDLATLTLIFGNYFPSLVVEKEHQDKVYPLSKPVGFFLQESGYMHLQATKPDTVGVGLNDSPVGLAAYIIEKFIAWTDPKFISSQDGGLKEKYSYTKLLDNVMIYWVSNSMTTSMRLYSETFGKNFVSDLTRIPTKVPSACARFTHDLLFSPTSILKLKYHNLVHVSSFSGGHFAAFELPKVLADDMYEAFSKILIQQYFP